jgi:hypothetical protein
MSSFLMPTKNVVEAFDSLTTSYSISYCKDNIKCDSGSNTPKCPQNNSVSFDQKLVVKLSNASTTFFVGIKKDDIEKSSFLLTFCWQTRVFVA